MRNPLNGLRHLSFSLYFTNKEGEPATLDLTCKDEYEFDFWVAGLKALWYQKQCMVVTKVDLLRHSWLFMKYLDAGIPAIGSQKMLMFTEEYLEKRSMDQCVKWNALNSDNLKDQLILFWDKIREFR